MVSISLSTPRSSGSPIRQAQSSSPYAKAVGGGGRPWRRAYGQRSPVRSPLRFPLQAGTLRHSAAAAAAGPPPHASGSAAALQEGEDSDWSNQSGSSDEEDQRGGDCGGCRRVDAGAAGVGMEYGLRGAIRRTKRRSSLSSNTDVLMKKWGFEEVEALEVCAPALELPSRRWCGVGA